MIGPLYAGASDRATRWAGAGDSARGGTGILPVLGAQHWRDAGATQPSPCDAGLCFFDNSWDYHDGKSEERMGKALSTGARRDKVFLMTKGGRTIPI